MSKHQTNMTSQRPSQRPAQEIDVRPPASNEDVLVSRVRPAGTSLPPRFTLTGGRGNELPLVLSDHAFLYVATGNDTPDYAERYGTDSTVLHYMHGARSLVFIRSGDSAREVEAHGQRAIQRFQELNQQTYKLPLPDLYDQHEFLIWSGETIPSQDGVAQAALATWELAHERGRDQDHFAQLMRNARFNQFTSIQLRHILGVIESTEETSREHGLTPSEVSRLEHVADQAVMLNNKAKYFEIACESSTELPRHVPTTVMSAEEVYGLMGTNQPLSTLRQLLGVADGAVVIKSAVEAGGECCVVLRGEHDNIQLAELFTDLRKKGRDLETTPCLIQRCVTPPDSDLPARIGILGYVGDNGYIDASTQVYSDPDRRTYLGSYWSEETAQAAVNSIGLEKINNLLDAFKSTGYVGPLGLDAMLDEDREYTLIYDANPRLTSAAAVLMVRDAVRKAGIHVTSAVSLGHHGNWEFPDLSSLVNELSRDNQAFTASSGRGVLLTPNPRGENRFDVFCINMNRSEIQQAFEKLVTRSSDAPNGLFF